MPKRQPWHIEQKELEEKGITFPNKPEPAKPKNRAETDVYDPFVSGELESVKKEKPKKKSLIQKIKSKASKKRGK